MENENQKLGGVDAFNFLLSIVAKFAVIYIAYKLYALEDLVTSLVNNYKP